MITQSINLNLIPGAVPPRIKVSQYDFGSRTLQFTLFNGTSPFTTASLSAVIQGTKPDNHGFSYDATYSAGVVTADITKQMTACAGAVICELVIVDGSNNKLGTGNFILDVEPSALSEDTDISDTEIPAIIDAAETNAERAEDAADRAEAASANPPYIGENEHWYVWDTSTEQYVDSGVDAEGVDGVGIVSIAKTGTVGLVDTYTITLSNGQTQTFTVTNGAAAVLPAGGTAQQVLMKNSSTDSDASWKDINTTASYKDMQAALGAPAGAGKNYAYDFYIGNQSYKTTRVLNGITFTVMSDGSIDLDGTASADFEAAICSMSLKTGASYVHSETLDGSATSDSGNFNTYVRKDGSNAWVATSSGNESSRTFTVSDGSYAVTIGVYVKNGKQLDHFKIYPMIRPAGTSADYVPHSDSIGTDVYATKAAVGAEENAGVNLLPIGASTSTKNDVTCTVNADKSIKLSGTASVSGEFILFEGGITIPKSIFSIGVLKNASTNAIVRVNGTEYLIPVDKTYIEIPAGTLDLCKVFFNQYFSQTSGVTYYPMVYPAYLVEPTFRQYVPNVQKKIEGYSATGTNSASEKARQTLGLSFPVQMKLEVFVADGAAYGVGTVYRADASATPTVTMLATSGLTFAKNSAGTIQALVNNAAVTATYKYSKI